MTTIYLIRHAKPAATWGEATNPGLDELGAQQAEHAAQELQRLQPIDLYTSPLQRCVETAAPLGVKWKRAARILESVAEIPSPPLSMQARQEWLRAGMQGTWSQLQATAPTGSPDFLQWRRQLLDSVRALTTDSVIFTHYIAINVLIGAAQGHDRVISFNPGHASISTMRVSRDAIEIVQLGAEATASGNILLGR